MVRIPGDGCATPIVPPLHCRYPSSRFDTARSIRGHIDRGLINRGLINRGEDALRSILRLWGVALFSVMVLALHPARAQSPDPQAVEDARAIISMTKTVDLIEQTVSQMLNGIHGQFLQVNPGREKDIKDLMDGYLMPAVRQSLPALSEDIAKLYAMHFTAKELAEMKAFYASPLGVRMIETMPAITQQSMVMGQAWGQRVLGGAYQEFARKAQERGLSKPKDM